MNNLNSKKIGLCGAGMAIAVGMMLMLCKGTTKVDIQEYTTVEATGFDGNGEITGEFDSKAIRDFLSKKSGIKSSSEREKFLESMKMKASESEDLSNGQEVTITVVYDEEIASKYKLKFKNTEWKYTVEGLEEGTQIDPFEYVEVSFSGKGPQGQATYWAENIPNVGTLHYEFDNDRNLSNGDEVTLTCAPDEEYLKDKGYFFTDTTKTYVVEGLTTYVQSLSDIDAGLAALKTESEDIVNAYLERGKEYYFENTGIKYEGTILLKAKDTNTSNVNEVLVIYSTTVSGGENHELAETTAYFPVRFSNVLKYEDGVLDYDRSEMIETDDREVYEYYQFFTFDGYVDSNKMLSDLVRCKTDVFKYEVSKELQPLFQ